MAVMLGATAIAGKYDIQDCFLFLVYWPCLLMLGENKGQVCTVLALALA